MPNGTAMPTLALTLFEPLSVGRRVPEVRGDPQNGAGLTCPGVPGVCGQRQSPWVPVLAAPGTMFLWVGPPLCGLQEVGSISQGHTSCEGGS